MQYYLYRLSFPKLTSSFRFPQIIVFGDKIVMVLELAGHGDLLEYIKLRGALDERRSRRMLSQITSAIEYLHSRNIVHRWLMA